MSILQGKFPILLLQDEEPMFAHLSLQESLTFMAAAKFPDKFHAMVFASLKGLQGGAEL